MPDREKVIKGLECCGEDAYGCCRECPYNDHRTGTIEYCTSALCVDALKLLKEQPEQKHGHWIEQDDCNDTYYECSVCGEPWVLIDGTPSENNMCFCPKCGAKMDGEVKQDA